MAQVTSRNGSEDIPLIARHDEAEALPRLPEWIERIVTLVMRIFRGPLSNYLRRYYYLLDGPRLQSQEYLESITYSKALIRSDDPVPVDIVRRDEAQKLYRECRARVCGSFEIATTCVDVNYRNDTLRIKVLCFSTHFQDVDRHTIFRYLGGAEMLENSAIHIFPLLEAFAQSNEEQRKNLTLFAISQYDTRVVSGNEAEKPFTFTPAATLFDANDEREKWRPSNGREMGIPLLAIEPCLHWLNKRESDEISFMFYSMGVTSLQMLLTGPSMSRLFCDSTMVLDRSFTSSEAVANNVFANSPWVGSLTFLASNIAGWNISTEMALTEGLQNMEIEESSHRPKVAIVEIEDDRFFKGRGAFSPTLCEQLAYKTSSVCRMTLGVPNPPERVLGGAAYTEVNNHGLPPHYLVNVTDAAKGDPYFNVQPGENLAHAYVRSVIWRQGNRIMIIS